MKAIILVSIIAMLIGCGKSPMSTTVYMTSQNDIEYTAWEDTCDLIITRAHLARSYVDSIYVAGRIDVWYNYRKIMTFPPDTTKNGIAVNDTIKAPGNTYLRFDYYHRTNINIDTMSTMTKYMSVDIKNMVDPYNRATFAYSLHKK